MYKTISRIIKWCEPFKKRLYAGFLFSFLSKAFILLRLVLTAYLLHLVIIDSQTTKTLSAVWALYAFLAIGVTILLSFLFDYLRAKYQESIGLELAANERIRIGELLKKVSLGYFTKHNTGEILSDITTGLDGLESMGIRMIDMVIGGYISVFLVLISLSILDIRLGLIVFLGVLLSVIFTKCISRKSQKTMDEFLASNKDLSGAIVEFARGLAVVKSFGVEGVTTHSLKKACKESKNVACKAELDYIPYNSMNLISLEIASVAVVILSLYLYIQLTIPLINVLIVFLLAFNMFNGVKGIAGASHLLGLMDNSLKRLDDLTSEDGDSDNGKHIKLNNFDIEFSNVTFAYDKRNVVNNVSFTLSEKTTTAIVGPSGSGKTTICNLLARFYDIRSGSITLGGYDIKEFTYDSLLSNMSMVFQNVYLFNDTIRNNILFGDVNATDEDIIRAAKLARCHDFIIKLPDGYNTKVGEGGKTLSGGERQRISIARAILKDASIIILDEATASIDPENESYIQDAILNLTKGKTVIIIAHRIATIENADKIIVMNNGEIAQHGTHESLKKIEGIYSDFLKIRAKAENFQM